MTRKNLLLLFVVFVLVISAISGNVVPVKAATQCPNGLVIPGGPADCPILRTCTNGLATYGLCPAGTDPIPDVLYAIPIGGAVTGECKSWATACTLQYAIGRAKYFIDLYPNLITSINIYAKEGTYKPDPSDPAKSFPLYNGIAIYGGFDGTEVDDTTSTAFNCMVSEEMRHKERIVKV